MAIVEQIFVYQPALLISDNAAALALDLLHPFHNIILRIPAAHPHLLCIYLVIISRL